MYSTKHLENILLAELTRKQYKQFMDDVADSTGLYFKQIRNVRNSDTFKKVFGNKQRIWIPLDIEVDSNVIGDNKETYNSLYRKHISVNQTLSNILNGVADLFSLWETITRLAGKQEIDTMKIKSPDLLLYWLKGYVKVNGRIFKFGTLINRLLSMAKKVYANDEIALNNAIKELSRYLSNFQNRKNELDKLPKDLLDMANSLTDEDIYGTAIKKDKFYICISRYPADVAAMSTGQGWSSCQNLDHDETKTNIDYTYLNWHVKYDIAMGTCVAYLIKESAIKRSMQKQNVPTKYDDKFKGKTHIPKTSLFPLLSPTARIAIKPFYGYEDSNEGQVYLSIGFLDDMENGINTVLYGDNKYGQIFFDTVNSYLEERQADISGNFIIPDELYNESLGHHNIIEVRNGKIVDTFGENSMLDEEPTKMTERTFNKITKHFVNSIVSETGLRKYGIVLGGKDITGEYKYKENRKLVFVDVNIIDCHITANQSYANIYFNLPENIVSQIVNIFRKQNSAYEEYAGYFRLLKQNFIPKIKEFIDQKIYTNRYNPILVENSTFEKISEMKISKQVTLRDNTFNKVSNMIFMPYNCKQTTNNSFISCIQTLWLGKLTDKDFVTANTYIQCNISIVRPVVTELKSDDLIYFVGDTFEEDCKMTGKNNDLEKIRFIDCTFNGEKIEGEAKIADVEVKNGDSIKNINVELNIDNIERI